MVTLEPSTSPQRLLGPGLGGSCFCLLRVWLLVAAITPSVRGPRPSSCHRDPWDLDKGRVTLATAALRLRLLKDIQQRPEQEARTCATEGLLLEEYGRCMYKASAIRRDYAETINAVQKLCFLRTFMTGPGEC